MSVMAAFTTDRQWSQAAAVAVFGHAAVVATLGYSFAGNPSPRIPDPVVLVDLSLPVSEVAAASSAVPVQRVQPRPELQETTSPSVPQPVAQTDFDIPESPSPTPSTFAAAPPLQPVQAQPVRTTRSVAIAAPTSVIAPTSGKSSDADAVSASDPRAEKASADYFSMISAHLNRKKDYPSEAKKARQQGVVTVRFTVHPDGDITNSSIKKSSGFALLDNATLDLMRRVAPLPKMPKFMPQKSVTIALPIDYSLRTK